MSTGTTALSGFLNIAKRVGSSVETLEEACQVIANIQHPWLLVLDNADDTSVDYQCYFPSGNTGIILMTSRNPECSRYGTLGTHALEGLDKTEAQDLLLNAIGKPEQLTAVDKASAPEVAKLLGYHALALIQAGAYVARGHCTLSEYAQVFNIQREQLLKFHPSQAQSRYRHVYATFEASAQTLEQSSEEAAKDALDLLSVMSMMNYSPLPLSLFETAWAGAREVITDTEEDDEEVDLLSTWHVDLLISLIQPKSEKWSSFRLIEACHQLESLSLISINASGSTKTFTMHPLTHAWARDRQEPQSQDRFYISTGAIIALSAFERGFWLTQGSSLKPHLDSWLERDIQTLFLDRPPLMVARIVYQCGWMLLDMRDDSNLYTLLDKTFATLRIDKAFACKPWLSLYQLLALNLTDVGPISQAVKLLEQVVKMRESLAENDPARLGSLHHLAITYYSNGRIEKAIQILEQVVKIGEYLPESHPTRLAPQHELANAYRENGQVGKAVQILEQVVEFREDLPETHPDRLASQHSLARAYRENGQVGKAVQILEQVVKINEYLPEHRPNRLISQHELARAYQKEGQIGKAVRILEQMVKIEEYLPENHLNRLVSQHNLATAYYEDGKKKEAIDLMAYVVSTEQKALPHDHPGRLASEEWLHRWTGR